jgi:hypothetical protein
MESQRAADEKLLALLGVKYIADLMVEVKKKKLGLHISSSEKAESERYSKVTFFTHLHYFLVVSLNGLFSFL